MVEVALLVAALAGVGIGVALTWPAAYVAGRRGAGRARARDEEEIARLLGGLTGPAVPPPPAPVAIEAPPAPPVRPSLYVLELLASHGQIRPGRLPWPQLDHRRRDELMEVSQ